MSRVDHRDQSRVDEFYVGYLPMPEVLARRTRRTVALIVVVFVACSVAIALAMRDPGNGVWDTGQIVTITGTYRTSPCPAVDTTDPASGPVRVLLVEEGKFGGRSDASRLDGRRVTARGHILRRENLVLLELLPSDDVITDEGPSVAAPRDVATNGSERVTMRGEILDPKCFAGAMKPGDGKTHKGCAVLCIRGGLPPVFASWSAEGVPTLYLLVDRNGEAIRASTREAIEPFIADWVEITGDLQHTHGMPTIRIDTAAVRWVR